MAAPAERLRKEEGGQSERQPDRKAVLLPITVGAVGTISSTMRCGGASGPAGSRTAPVGHALIMANAEPTASAGP